ncbi:MAG: tRNA 2-thiocytidine biosynthesis protein TtcA [Clostridia bacterium]|nr:tRNA 2-thiocytidine biosynthesis protein TtcA [Clostridia bacterium]
MSKERTFAEETVYSITKSMRKELWTPFIAAVKRYKLIEEGDRIAVCVSGGKDSMLLAKMMQLLQKYSEVPFENVYLVMDPGYSPANRAKIEENAAKLEIPVTIFDSGIFSVSENVEKNPCYLCARMRRGYLYAKAKELGCNKIALGHHRNDVIETTLMAMLYGAQLQGMMPKLRSANFEGMELIRPLYCVREEDVVRWRDRHHLEFLRCACRLTEEIEESGDGVGPSKRQEVKALIASLKKDNPLIEENLFNSIHSLHLDTFPEYKQHGVFHDFVTHYGELE